MTTTQAVEMSVIVNISPIQDYIHPDDHTLNLLILHTVPYYRKLMLHEIKLLEINTT